MASSTTAKVRASKPQALNATAILSALRAEQKAATEGIAFKAVSTRRSDALLVVELEPLRNSRGSTPLDESLEGARAAWFDDNDGRGEVVVVDSDRAEIALRYVQGAAPVADQTVWLYPIDFLGPLIDLWARDDVQRRSLSVLKRKPDPPIAALKPASPAFSRLRTAQVEALSLPLHPVSTVIGPPGTGKTTTVGALTANLLRRFPDSRVLVVGPTNVAVDTALISVDDWLGEIGREDIKPTLKRIGSRFDIRKYGGRDHLLASGLYQASMEVALIELEEPLKSDMAAYVAWKDRLDAARAKLKTDVLTVASSARVVAMTTASLARYFDEISASKWHFVIADEASQIMLPAAITAASIARNVLFAGDPHQLAPIVKSADPDVQRALSGTAFEHFPQAKSVFLDEQSRMAHAICDVVSTTFYDSRLKVCPKARKDPQWRKDRDPWFVDGRVVPRVMVDDRAGDGQWSAKYNGMIRFQSAQIVEALVCALLGSYVTEDEMLILTPFRAQRALLRSMLRRYGQRGLKVSTVHRSQGSESKIVIFDPVDGGGSFLNSDTGRRLINVAASRAQAHLLLTVGPKDLTNPYLAAIQRRSKLLWDKPGQYATPFRVSLVRG